MRLSDLRRHISGQHPMDGVMAYTVYRVLCAETDAVLMSGITENLATATRRVYAKIPQELCRIDVVGRGRTYREAADIKRGMASGQRVVKSGEAVRIPGPVMLRFD